MAMSEITALLKLKTEGMADFKKLTRATEQYRKTLSDISDIRNEALKTIDAELQQTQKLTEIKRQEYEATALACLLYTSPSPRDRTRSRMPSSA